MLRSNGSSVYHNQMESYTQILYSHSVSISHSMQSMISAKVSYISKAYYMPHFMVPHSVMQVSFHPKVQMAEIIAHFWKKGSGQDGCGKRNKRISKRNK
jgi:hypothetical protein